MPAPLLLQISSGRGPAECQRAVLLMVGALEAEAKSLGLTADLLEWEEGDRKGCLLSALVQVTAPAGREADLDRWGRSLEGAHQWVCKSPFRPGERRKNWFFGISRLPSEAELTLDPSQVRFEAMRASGPGGQHVNKTCSAVRVTWEPTGLSCVASGERSQLQNRRVAMARLQQKVNAINASIRLGGQQEAWMEHNTLERGRAVRRYQGDRFALCAT